jgi:hypothetical protein
MRSKAPGTAGDQDDEDSNYDTLKDREDG